MKITTIGLDLAKEVFQVHGVDEAGRAMLAKKLRRSQVLDFFVKLPPCLIGMEACGSAHHWARELTKLGHTTKLMAPQFVRPYVKSHKTDARDAEAICEAVQRPGMRFVPVKTVEQQTILALHRARSGLVKARTALGNQIRGLLREFGIALPPGIKTLAPRVSEALAKAGATLPGERADLMTLLLEQFRELGERASALESRIRRLHRDNPASHGLESIPGIGPLTASALVASIGDAKAFKSGREFAAWLGLVPRQYSSGGKTRLLGISKRGDAALRTLLVHGARAVIRVTSNKPGHDDSWLMRLCARRHKNIAAVALAAKNARIAWALLARGQPYCAEHGGQRP